MRFSPSILDEIKARMPVSAVVGRRVRLTKAGREWKGLSPFNAEKTASFFVNDDKQRYFDFSSGRNGDIFNFVMETEGLSFSEAVERLAAEAGVSLPRETPEEARREQKRQGLHEVVELATQWFEYELTSARGARARAYLDGRGLGPEVRRRFRLGYAPAGRHELQNALAAKGVAVDAMIDAGLLIAGDDIPTPYDRFRDRVIFPIADPRGRPVAFGGRAMAAEVQPKYLNSPETPLFHKGGLLYNFHNARKALQQPGASQTSAIVVVEGYVDVIALDMAGAPQAVAPLGTALTPEQLTLLWRSAETALLCFDGDKAGRRAAFRALDVALPLLAPGKTVNFVLMPEGQDPDDLLRQGGREAVLSALRAQIPMVELLWRRETEGQALDTPDQRAALEHRLRDAAMRIQDDTLRRHYRAEIDARIAALTPAAPQGGQGRYRNARAQSGAGFARGGAGSGRSGGWGQSGKASGMPPGMALAGHPGLTRSAEFPREMLIVALLIAHPHFLVDLGEQLAAIDFRGPEARQAARELLDCVARHGAAADHVGEAEQAGDLRQLVASCGLADRLDGLRRRMAAGAAWALEPEADALAVEEMLRQALTLQSRAGALHTELTAAQRAFAEEESEANFSWLCDVKARLDSLDGAEAQAGDRNW